jgi:hypothetical protein
MESKEQFATVTRTVNSRGGASLNLNDKLAVQDEFGKATMDQIVAYARALDNTQRKMFVWCAFTCLGYESAVEIVNETLLRPMLAQAEETLSKAHEAAMGAVYAKEKALEHDRVLIEGQLREAQRHTDALQASVLAERAAREALQTRCEGLRAEVDALKAENARLAEIEAAVKLLNSLR